jgi:hypothetical protein
MVHDQPALLSYLEASWLQFAQVGGEPKGSTFRYSGQPPAAAMA